MAGIGFQFLFFCMGFTDGAEPLDQQEASARRNRHSRRNFATGWPLACAMAVLLLHRSPDFFPDYSPKSSLELSDMVDCLVFPAWRAAWLVPSRQPDFGSMP
jgi:hypothetical protein